MKITTIAADFAKSVIQIYGVDSHGNTVLRKQLKRSRVMKFFTKLEPCLIGMEACGSAVIPPLLDRAKSRGQAAKASFCFGVMPPSAMLGRS